MFLEGEIVQPPFQKNKKCDDFAPISSRSFQSLCQPIVAYLITSKSSSRVYMYTIPLPLSHACVVVLYNGLSTNSSVKTC